jgi:hypothetical protein
MKKITTVLVFFLVLLTACGGIKSTSKGLENESYLEFVSQSQIYPDGVSVTVDNTLNFKADVYKDKTDRTKGKVYAISVGAHTISVSYNNQLLYNKKIFISTQETKYILLP